MTSSDRPQDLQGKTEKAHAAPGSPSKASPSKWKGGSSAEHKQQLLAMTRQFWSLMDDGQSFSAPELSGPRGAETARALMVSRFPLSNLQNRADALGQASCAYIDPLERTPLSAAPTLLDRFKAVSPSKQLESLKPPSSSLSALSTSTVEALAPDSDEENYHFSQFDSQVPYTQLANEALAAATTRSSRSRPSSIATAPPSPEKPSAESTTSFGASSSGGWTNPEYHKAGKDSKCTFVFDLAHRDVLALKADAQTARQFGAGGARGIQAKKFAPEMVSHGMVQYIWLAGSRAHPMRCTQADAVSINRRLAGIHKAHSKVRPYTILPELETEATRPSPSKKAKTW